MLDSFPHTPLSLKISTQKIWQIPKTFISRLHLKRFCNGNLSWNYLKFFLLGKMSGFKSNWNKPIFKTINISQRNFKMSLRLVILFLLSLKCKISAIWLVETACIFLIFLITTVPISIECEKQETYNHFHNILRLFNVLRNFPFTTSETMRNYYLSLIMFWHSKHKLIID